MRRAFLIVFGWTLLAANAPAEPLSRPTEIDFFRDLPSRNLRGLAARSDGRLVVGPRLTDLTGPAPADLLWTMVPTADPQRWIVGTGPDGKIFEVTLDLAQQKFGAREIAKLDESHVFALAMLPDGSVLAGTSSRGALCWIKDGKVTARVTLPVDSVLDLLVVSPDRVLAATGNPARIYQIDLKRFAAVPVAGKQSSEAKATDAKVLAEQGVSLIAEIRDRNARRLARLANGDIAVGSSPKGNIYALPAAGGAPVILQENRDAEVTDFLPTEDGGFYAAVTFASGTGESRVSSTKTAKEGGEAPAAAAPERFGGRGTLLWFPPRGFPEVLAARAGTSVYQLARHERFVLMAGGEQGDVFGYDTKQRFSLTFPGSVSAQLNGLQPIPAQPGRYLLLRNNAPGFALLDFTAQESREAETRRLDLGVPGSIGAFRFSRVRDAADAALDVELRTSLGSDEIEGWSGWTKLTARDDGWYADGLRGRYVKIRVKLAASAPATAELDRAALYSLPQNRRPQLQEFHFLSPNYGLIPAPEPPAPAVTSLSQLLQGKEEEAKKKTGFLSSQVVPQPGAQVVLWTVVDPDGDNVVYTFSLRRDGDSAWTDVALNTREPYAQFDTTHLADGVYFTRLIATESDPRLAADRLAADFETDDLVVDHTPPQILEASAAKSGDRLVIRVRGRDALSLVDGIEATFNNGTREQTEQPADGIRDGREEIFVLDVPLARVAGASSAEVLLYDAIGNSAATRLNW